VYEWKGVLLTSSLYSFGGWFKSSWHAVYIAVVVFKRVVLKGPGSSGLIHLPPRESTHVSMAIHMHMFIHA